jgi:hypothetical protein
MLANEKPRLRKYKSLSFSADDEIEKMVNERCSSLGITRTSYILSLIRDDLMRGGPLMVRESAMPILPPRVGKGLKREKKKEK